MRKKRGVKAGCPDNWVVDCGKLICVELKSPVGRCSQVQRAVREALIGAGAEWWECKTSAAAMSALAQSGVRFREIVRKDGSVERWRKPDLSAWEAPRRDPHERRPMHPMVAAKRRDEARRRRERRRARALEEAATRGAFLRMQCGDAKLPDLLATAANCKCRAP
jgi:hypothetical protein